MRTFLLWRRDDGPGAELDPESVADSLRDVLRPLFASPPPVRLEHNGAAAMVFVHLPVEGWNAPFVQDDRHGRAYAVDYPVAARRVLAQCGVAVEGDSVLPALGRALADDPVPVLRELAPPFSLVWWPHAGDEVLLQTDGLGQAQVFEYDDGSLWAATNRISALRALGLDLEMDALDWAVKCTHGWFPMGRTGYRNVRLASPGTQVRLGRSGVRHRRSDVLSDWVRPGPMSAQEALELARCSLIRHIRDGAPYWARPAAGLSGGWDTRAVVSSFVASGVDFRTKVKGQEGKFDVTIARRLASIAGLDLEVRETAELPPERTEDLERSIRLALLWQAGHMWSENHKSFLWSGPRHVDGGALNVMGQHGEIARGHYERRIRAWEAEGEHEYEQRVIAFLTGEAAPGIRPEMREGVRELIRESFRQADRWGLSGLAALDFLYLIERTRRYNGASLTAQFGLVFTPFLNPDLIRAAYALRAAGAEFVRAKRQVNPIHRHIIDTNMPAWRGVEFEEDLRRAAKAARARERAAAQGQPARRDWRPAQGKEYYDYDLYWEEVGRPIVERITSREGFWTQIFDPVLLRANGRTPPVEVAMVELMAESLERAPA